MSDAGTGTPAAADSVAFAEREMQMLAWAMQSLKSGPPDIDYEKLARFAGMSNPRSASNAWAKIRAKLNLATPATPKKGAAKKKATPKGDGGDHEGSESPVKKTPRKRGPKKQDVDGASPSPKKKKIKGKARATTVETEADVKSEVKKEAVDDSADEAGADATLDEI